MSVFQVYKKSILEQIRDYKALLLTLLSPIMFIVIFGLAFGQGFYTYDIAITNADKGGLGKEFLHGIKTIEYSNGNKFFVVKEVPENPDQILHDLKSRKYAAHVYISEDFSDKIINNDSAAPSELRISGDPAYSLYGFTKMALEKCIDNFLKETSGLPSPLSIKTNKINELEVKSEFDAMAPGLIVMSVYFLLILSAMVLAKEVENKTLQRILSSRLKAWQLYGGITLSQLTLAMVMLPMVIASTFMLGFRSGGSLPLSFFIGCFASLSAIGVGMMIAAFSRNAMDAFIIGNVVLFPMSFLTGIFLPAPDLTLFSIAGLDLSVLSLLPLRPAVMAANKALLSSGGFSDIVPDMALLGILTLLYWFAGVLLFDRKYMRKSMTTRRARVLPQDPAKFTSS